MIASSIDGSVGGSTQLFDLLSLVSDPEAYAKKVKALEESTAENKKYVELVAPASDILRLREVAQQDRILATEELAKAHAQAAEIISAAKKDAEQIRDSAHTFANEVKQVAQKTLNEANAKKAELDGAIKESKQAASEAKKAASDFEKKAVEAAAEKALAAQAKGDAESMKASIIAKHKAFIESL
jgi:F0F1-type ATP synthase membrane subunit b/b'